MKLHTRLSELWEAYRATTYHSLDGHWQVRVDEPAPVVGPLVWLTSDNPGSQLLDDDQNLERRHRLSNELEERGYSFWPGRSVADDGNWPDELGFWIRHSERADRGETHHLLEEARHLGRRYDQNALIFVDSDRRVSLEPCAPDTPTPPAATSVDEQE